MYILDVYDRPWAYILIRFHENMYHLVNDVSMILFHKHTTPPAPSFSSSSNEWRYDAKLLKFPTSHGTLPWAHQVFFTNTAFEAGTQQVGVWVCVWERA
jgi:hypothetical protein